MQGIPLVKSKLIMPQLSRTHLKSERLSKLGAAIRERGLVTVTAPAGYGKTTLIVAALAESISEGSRVCWYRLERDDASPGLFCAHLIEALFPGGARDWEEARRVLGGAAEPESQYHYLSALLCQEVWSAHDRGDLGRLFLVLDDFHQVQGAPGILSTVRYLIDNLPGCCSVIISGRLSDGILTPKQRLDRDALELTARDLCFSEAEIGALLLQAYGIRADRNTVAGIMLNTEGWAAGIIMVCQALSGGAREAVSLWGGDARKEALFRYITAEVLPSAGESLMLFLVKAAFLQDFTAAEAGAILSIDRVPQLLEECERRGLFVQKIVGEATTYRFHTLFREALRQLQPRYLDPGEVERCHLKAAAYYVEHSHFERAIEHFIACGSVEQAVALVTRESARLIAFEAADQYRLWISLLPEPVVSGSAHLLFIKSFVYYERDLDYTLELLEQALALFRQAGDAVMQFHTLIQISNIYLLRNDVLGMRKASWTRISEFCGAMRQLPCKDLLLANELVVEVFEENLARVAISSRRVKSLALNEEWQYAVRMASFLAYWGLGDLDLAEGEMREALDLEFVKKSAFFKGYCKIMLCLALQLKDELDALTPELNELLEIGEKNNFRYIPGWARRVAAVDRYRRHDLEGALEQIDASIRLFEEIGNTPMASSNRLYRCLWLCSRENPEPRSGAGRRSTRKLLAEAGRALKDLTAAPTGMCLQEAGLSLFGAIARECEARQPAEKNLLAAVKRSRAKGAKQILAGASLHLAMLYYETGESERGEGFLRQALDIASANQYVTFWDLHLPTLVEMAARCLQSGIHADHALKMVRSNCGDEAAVYLEQHAPASRDTNLRESANVFCARFATVRQEAPTEPSAVFRAQLLGKFGIEVNGTAVPDSAWKTRKIRSLLQYLLLHRDRTVQREQLMELFWPESEPQFASMSLRAALYELRKVLARHTGSVGKSELIQETSVGLKIRADANLMVDTDRLTTLYRAWKSGADRAGSIGILQEMASGYRGDLLDESPYEEWTVYEREAFKSLFLEGALALARLLIEDGEHRQAEQALLKALSIDRYNEDACLLLINLYLSTHQRGRALKLYTNFKSLLKKELDIEPDERFAAVLGKLTVPDQPSRG